MPKLDRTQFKIQTFEEADNTREYWLSKTPNERFAAAWYLICCAWNIDMNNPPKLDRTVFSTRKHGEYLK
jgi:hypothetical protein